MPSKMIIDRQKSSESVQAACLTHRDRIAAGLADTLGDSALVKSAQVIVDKSVSTLLSVTQSMIAADDENVREQAESSVAREVLERASGNLHADLVDLRSAVASVFTDAEVRTLGYTGDTPNDTVALERLGVAVAGSLDALKAAKPRVPGFVFDPKPWKKRIQDHLAPVADARPTLARELRESEGTLTTKQQAMTAYDAMFTRVATLASALLAIAGETELARRVRPSIRRPGQTVEDAGEPITPVEPPVA